MHRYGTRRSKRKQSLSDKLDIGAGKYVHNLEFPCSLQNTKTKAAGSSDGSSKVVNLSWSDTMPNKMGHYVTNLQLPSNLSHGNTSSVDDINITNLSGVDEPSNDIHQEESILTLDEKESKIIHATNASKVFDLVDLTEGILNQQESQTPSNDVVDLSCLSGDNLPKETSCSQTISKEIDGTTVDNNQANTGRVKPNFKKLYDEYLVKWRMNPPPNETRPMRLSELIWSNCDGSTNKFDVDYGSDDSKDIFLKSIAQRKSKPLRDILGDIDKKYEESKAKKEAHIQRLCDSEDDTSFQSALSNQSLIDFFSDKNQSGVNEPKKSKQLQPRLHHTSSLKKLQIQNHQ